MAWDYAELSKLAKENGGPEKLVESLFNSGKNSGIGEMLPLIGIALGMGVVATAAFQRVWKYFIGKKAESNRAVELAKQELIQGIKEYDETHTVSQSDLQNRS